jgi:hypothetical protein
MTAAPTATILNILPPVEADHTTAHVTVDELRDILFARRGSGFISFVALYDMSAKGKMRKTNNPHIGNCYKLAETSAMVTFDYERSMEARGDEASGTGNWSQAVVRDDGTLTPLSVHGKDVESVNPLRCIPNARAYLRHEWRSGTSKYVRSDGSTIDKAEVAPFLPKREARTVEFATASLNSIVRLTMDKVTYIVRPA